MYKDTATEPEYMRYNKKFQDWFNKEYGSKTKIEEDHVRDFVSEYVKAGQDSNIVIAALSFRFNFCEKRRFNFKGLRKQSKSPKPHKVMGHAELAQIFESSKTSIDMCTALHLLYDLAARAQDLVVLTYGQLLNEHGTKWKMKKTGVIR